MAGRRLGIRTILMLTFGTVVLVGIVGVLLVSLGAARLNTFSLLSDKAELSIDALDAELRRYLDAVSEASRYVAAQINSGDVAIDDASRLRVHLRAAMAAAPQILGMGLVTTDGRWIRTPRMGSAIRLSANPAIENPILLKAIQRMTERRRPFWGPPLYQPEIDGTLVNYRSPIIVDGRVVGMLVAVVSVGRLSADIAAYGQHNGLRTFILYGHDRVLAHQGLIGTLFHASMAEPLPRLDQVGDPVLARLWDETGRRPMAIKFRRGTKGFAIEGKDGVNVAIYREIAGYGPEPLFVGAIIPPGSELADELNRLMGSGVIGLSILLAAIIASLVIGRLLSRPVGALAGAAREARALEFADIPRLGRSRMREIDDAATAFNHMIDGLRWFENYVPRPLVRHILAEGGAEAVTPAEHRITVLFTDIVGFTRLAEHLDAAETTGLINQHLSLIAPEIDREEGLIDKYIGDSMMAFWGPPRTTADHALRACRAARAIAAKLAEDNAARRARGEAPIHIRIGLHSGPAMVGNIGAPGRVNYTVIGDTVNVAQRLEELGKALFPDDPADAVILISEDVRTEAGGIDGAVPCGEHAIRGREADVAVYRI